MNTLVHYEKNCYTDVIRYIYMEHDYFEHKMSMALLYSIIGSVHKMFQKIIQG